MISRDKLVPGSVFLSLFEFVWEPGFTWFMTPKVKRSKEVRVFQTDPILLLSSPQSVKSIDIVYVTVAGHTGALPVIWFESNCMRFE